MTNDSIFPIAEAEKLISQFIECTLPKTEWTHEAHLMTGLYHLAKFGDQALPEMRLRIQRYNESAGTLNDDHHGYHETMTVFWLWILREVFADENGTVHWNQDTLDDLLFDENMSDRNLWLDYYSKERMLSVEARKRFVEPDL